MNSSGAIANATGNLSAAGESPLGAAVLQLGTTVSLMEKLIFGLYVADLALFVMLLAVACSACRSGGRHKSALDPPYAAIKTGPAPPDSDRF